MLYISKHGHHMGLRGKIIGYSKRAVLTFIWLFIVFFCSLSGFGLTVSGTDLRASVGIAFVYIFPWLWVFLFFSTELFRERKFILTRKKSLLLLSLSILLLIAVHILNAINLLNRSNDFIDIAIFGCIYLISFLTFRFYLLRNTGRW